MPGDLPANRVLVPARLASVAVHDTELPQFR